MKHQQFKMITENKQEDKQTEKIIVIGKVLENKKFEFKIDSDNPLSIIGDIKEDDRVRSYLQLIIEIYNYFEMWEYDWKRAIKAVIKIQSHWREKRYANCNGKT